VIAGAIVVVIMIIVIVQLMKTRETFLTLEEVIPQARILSHDEGIVEYRGVEYILGVHNLKDKKRLIESLDLLNVPGPCVVDLSFRTQVVIKQEPGFYKKTGSENTQ